MVNVGKYMDPMGMEEPHPKLYPHSRSKDMPMVWEHAGLDSLVAFLKEEQTRGNFTPEPGLPF